MICKPAFAIATMIHYSCFLHQAQEYANSLDRYGYLWVDDRQEFLRQFLLYGHMLTADEIDAAGEEGVPETPPGLTQFKEQVDGFEAIYGEVEALKVIYDAVTHTHPKHCNGGSHYSF